MILTLLVSLSLTLVLELLLALVWGVRGKGLLLVLCMNVMTNPAAVTLYTYFVTILGWNWLPVTLVLEAAVVVTEGLCCRGMIRRSWLFAFVVNLFSYGVGELLQIIF